MQSPIFKTTTHRYMKGSPQVDDYISGFPKEIQEILQQVRSTIQAAAPTATETIKYAMPTFVFNGNLIHFAAFKKHLGLFSVPTGDHAFDKDFAPYHTGKGSIQFPYDKPLPLNLVTRIVKYNVEINKRKK